FSQTRDKALQPALIQLWEQKTHLIAIGLSPHSGEIGDISPQRFLGNAGRALTGQNMNTVRQAIGCDDELIAFRHIQKRGVIGKLTRLRPILRKRLERLDQVELIHSRVQSAWK